MTEILSQLKDIIQSIILGIGYPGIALIMLAENLFPPIPSELVMPFAGFLVADGKMNLVAAILSGTVGALLGAIALYYIGYWADEPIVRGFIRKWGRWFLLEEEDLNRAMAFFAKYGEPVIFFGRLIPIIRSLISLPAGMNKMGLPKFMFFTTLGTLIWNTVLTIAGMFLGSQWENILGVMKQYERIVIVICVLAVIAFVVYRVIQIRNRNQTATQVSSE